LSVFLNAYSTEVQTEIKENKKVGEFAVDTDVMLTVVSFEGDDPCNASAWAYTLDGQCYPACTTVQHGYKPCQNSASLTVEAPKTDATAPAGNEPPTQPECTTVTLPPPKTQEQVEQEAKDNGWLRVWHEFSWWFPWYRIHYVYVYEGVDQFDQGMSPLPLAGVTLDCSDAFLKLLAGFWSRVIWPIAGALVAAELTALVASNAGPTGFVAALLVSIGMKGLSLINNWNSVNGLISALIGSVFSTVVGLLKWTWSLAADFFKLLMGVIDLAGFGFGNLYRILSFPVTIGFEGQILQRLHELGAIA
jgi:hypothetical protein